MLRNHPAPGPGFLEHVLEQLALVPLDPVRERWVRLLAGNLDPRGYLPLSDEELLEEAREEGLEPDPGELGAALAVLQSLEPRGIGARDAVEALLLQLDPADPDYALLCTLIEDFLEDVARNKLPAVARAMGLELDRLGELLELLRGLELHPGSGLAAGAAPALVPEVMVTPSGDGFEVRVEQSGLPAVSVDEDVRRFATDRRNDPAVRSYLRGRLDQARWIVEAVEQRRQTLLRVATALFAHQRAFLEHGPGHLLPLRMMDLAEGLGLHVSTVSRAVAGKYAQTPWGILPLRHFFQGAGGASAHTARGDVRELVREVIAGEDPARPFSDDEVVAELKRRGLAVARRTVAKYRVELGIPSSYRRRRYGA